MADFRIRNAPSKEVTRYLSGKGIKPSFHWRDVSPREHAFAFTIAKMTKLDLLIDTHASLNKALTDGTPFKAWAKEIAPHLAKEGWWGKKEMIDPKTGETIIAQLGSPRRLKTIYWANTRSARAAGLWERAQRTKKALPYFAYRLGPSERHRPHHASKAGVILPVDDPFWDAWFPPNGWMCKCWIEQITRYRANKLGGESERPEIEMVEETNPRTGETVSIPKGVSFGWHGNPGKNRAQTLVDNLNLKLENAGAITPALPKAIIKEFWQSRAPEAYSQMSERVHLPVAYVPKWQGKLDGKTPLVVVSSDTVSVKVGKHMAVEASAFVNVQDVLEFGEAYQRKGRRDTTVFHRVDGVWWAVALQRSKDGYFYIATFFRTSSGYVQRFRDNHVLIDF
ncbi:Phage Mu protein F like protein [Cohaesibacter sp. ES.047]|uniref:phage head morphogenesis protein n=1 Tax=Cohaesibacter sp. ES.047 TaxID=1798205 RepID=UPI000BB98768|nr:phage minor head protein [Cohaesibacter sp. ES.047]SNY91385.1 Phage Mu protein F like protein [Cohaesibacter sp. ES.047]